MLAVWRFPVEIGEETRIKVDRAARLLSFGLGGDGIPSAYYLVDPQAKEKTTRKVLVVGTGWPRVPESANYGGTFYAGSFVWHLFEVRE